MPEMNALLTAIALWLSANFHLPVQQTLPRIERVPQAQLGALSHGAMLSKPAGSGIAENTAPASDIMALYDDETGTIFLRQDWTGSRVADLSILVHEMVHHGQHLAGLTYACPQEREKLAYQAQEQWLALFGTTLEAEFGIDPFSRLAKTLCFF